MQIDKTKRNSLTLEQKVEIIKLLGEQAHTKAHLAKQFGVDRSTIRKIELQKERVLLSVSTICIENCQRKYVSTGKHHELEEVLYYWVRQMKPQQKFQEEIRIVIKIGAFNKYVCCLFLKDSPLNNPRFPHRLLVGAHERVVRHLGEAF